MIARVGQLRQRAKFRFGREARRFRMQFGRCIVQRQTEIKMENRKRTATERKNGKYKTEKRWHVSRTDLFLISPGLSASFGGGFRNNIGIFRLCFCRVLYVEAAAASVRPFARSPSTRSARIKSIRRLEKRRSKRDECEAKDVCGRRTLQFLYLVWLLNWVSVTFYGLSPDHTSPNHFASAFIDSENICHV